MLVSVAVQAEALYLINLLLAPGLGFLGLLWLAHRNAGNTSELSRCHLRQTITGSVWAGILLLIVTAIIVALGGFQSPYTWVILILYFVTCHASLVLLGVLGLARALANQTFVFPLIGSRRW
jgi:hypothetical protein